ncbi:MAG: PAS domain S-box protein [Planctomycetota bacterium]
MSGALPPGLDPEDLDPELFFALAEASAAITFIYSGERNIYANPAAERATGYSREELLQFDFWHIIHPDCRDQVRERGEARQRGEPVPASYEVKILTKSGESRWLDFTGVRVELRGRVAVLGTAFDVTERVLVREALRSSEAKYRRLVDNALVGVMRTTLTGRILFANRAALRLLGVDRVDQLDPGGLPAHYADPRERQRLLELLRRDGKVEQFEVSMRRASGELVRIEANASLDGGVISGVFLDVTERRQLELEALRGQKLESLGLLAGGLAHDFNNFLAAILGNLGLARAAGGPEARPYLDQAERACVRARGLTEQLLAFARGGEPRKQAVELEGYLRDSVGFALRGSNVRCDWELASGLPRVEIDEAQIAQVVHNLVLNAVQAMPGGGTLTVGAREVEGGVSISFRDEGPGVPPADAQRIFDPYFTTKDHGRGLGLAAAHTIALRHAGALRLLPGSDSGACFELVLPAAPPPALPAAPPAAAPAPPSAGSARAARILVMDDEAPIRDLLQAVLHSHGHEVTTTADGAAAVEAYREALHAGRRFDLVLLDLTVPGGLGGVATLDLLRPLDPDVRAAVVSGYAAEPLRGSYQEHGFVGWLQKPFTVAELARFVATLVA